MQAKEWEKESLKEAWEGIGASVAWSLREVGDSIEKRRKLKAENVILPKLKEVRAEMSSMIAETEKNEKGDLALGSLLVFLMTEVVDKAEELAEEVDQLGEIASFHTDVTNSS